MDQRGAQLTPLAELDDLRPLVARPTDVLSVCLPLRPANEEMASEARLEWRALREQAERAGAPPEALTAVDRAADGAHRDRAGLHVVVPTDGRPHVEGLERSPAGGSVSWAPVPALVPLLADRQRQQPHVVALVDRQGADIVTSTGRLAPGAEAPEGTGGSGGTDDAGDGGSAVTAAGTPTTTKTTVEGDTHPLRKVAPGGWSQRRFQQRAEETWQRNMGEVAEEITARVEQVGARFVALGGDERAVHLVRDHLPAAVRELVRPLSVTRATDGSAARLQDELDRVGDDWLHAEITRMAEAFREELGQHDRAVAGPRECLAALQAARVAQLIVVGGAPDAAPNEAGDAEGAPGRAWVGATTEDVALSRADLLDPEQGRPAPLLDVAVAAALATGADVRVVPVDPADPDPPPDLADLVQLPGGLGALLRW